MSVTGKVVREINQDELGPINIGRNITEFAWDGKDQFGDQLANGVYFYRVIVKNNNEIVEERQQNINNASVKGNMSDKLFKNGYGKMYLMR
jgi:flagellar hook assembly protein FlgD